MWEVNGITYLTNTPPVVWRENKNTINKGNLNESRRKQMGQMGEVRKEELERKK